MAKDKIVNTKYIAKLAPYADRFDNWKRHYKDWSGPLSRFLNLTQITHEDKLWVFFRSISDDRVPLVAADFAERVLSVYEAEYPGDLRPRRAIEAARSDAADAADASYTADAAYAAYITADAATYAADAAYAAYAAARAAARAASRAADAADAASYAAVRAAYDTEKERKAQIAIMKRYLK